MQHHATHPPLPAPQTYKTIAVIVMFGGVARALWTTVFIAALASELIPRPDLPPVPFYSYLSCKVVLFLLLGFFTPLTFWRFNSLNLGMLVAGVSTSAVEILQLWIPGHRFSLLELAGKLVLLMVGIALSLDARYDGRIKLGPLSVRLSDRHWHPEQP